MAVLQITNGACTGRGFADTSVSGYMSKFYDWITKIPASGGPGWNILLDKSIYPTTKTMTSMISGVIISSGHGFYSNEIIRYYTSGTIINGLTNNTDYYVTKVNDNSFKLSTNHFNVGIGTYINITNSGVGSQTFTLSGPYIIISDEPSPQINQVCKFMKVGYGIPQGSYIQVQYFIGWNNTSKILGSIYGGYIIETVDDGNFAYDFRGGDECMILQSRIGTTWDSTGMDTWTGDSTFLEGLDHSGTLRSVGVPGTNSVAYLRSGESSNITSGEYYYLYDYSQLPYVRLEYSKCTYVDAGADSVTFSGLVHTFPSGSVIGSYPHRYMCFGNNIYDNNSFCYSTYIPYTIPYTSHPNWYYCSNLGYGSISSSCRSSYEDGILNSSSPDEKGRHLMEKWNILEWASNQSNYTTHNYNGMNRFYGSANNLYLTKINSMARSQDGLIYGGKQYLYFMLSSEIGGYGGSASYAILYPDSVSSE